MIDPPHACPGLERVSSNVDAEPHPDYPLVYVDHFREFGLRTFDGGTSFLRISYCPFCGAEFPASLRHEWLERLRALGLEPEDDAVPAEMQDGTWWRNAGF